MPCRNVFSGRLDDLHYVRHRHLLPHERVHGVHQLSGRKLLPRSLRRAAGVCQRHFQPGRGRDMFRLRPRALQRRGGVIVPLLSRWAFLLRSGDLADNLRGRVCVFRGPGEFEDCFRFMSSSPLVSHE